MAESVICLWETNHIGIWIERAANGLTVPNTLRHQVEMMDTFGAAFVTHHNNTLREDEIATTQSSLVHNLYGIV